MRQIIANVAKLGYQVALREDKTVFDDSIRISIAFRFDPYL